MKYDVIVVGGGVAGLTAATYISKAGKKVILIEKNEKCGGLVNTFERDGFYFDAGIKAIENTGIVIPMVKELDLDIEFLKSYVSIGIEDEVINIEDINILNDYKELLSKFYPESKDEINAIIKVIRKVTRYVDTMYRIENPEFKNLKKDRDYIFKKLLPWLPSLIFTLFKINTMSMPVEKYLENIIKTPSLRDVISQHFFKNTPAFFALGYFSMYLDYFYPRGGTGKLPEALERKILENGGEISKETEIVKIVADKNLLKDQNGEIYEYKSLIWTADMKTFYSILETDNLNPNLRKKVEETKRKVLSCRGGDSIFEVFLEVDEPVETFGKISTGHFFYTPSRKGLDGIRRSELYKLMDTSLKKQDVLNWVKKFVQFNTFEISIPGLKDPNMIPEDKTGVIVNFLADYELFKKVEEAGWYEEFKAEIEKLVIETLSNTIYPFLKTKLIRSFSLSPLSVQKRVGTSEGAITGWAFDSIPVVNRLYRINRSVMTPFPNIFQAGQWVYSPAGVPMSILTGKLAAKKILMR